MKKLIVFLLIIVAQCAAFAQGAQTYSAVIKIDSLNAENLYQTSKQWILLNYRSPRNVIQDDNPSMNTITGKGSIKYSRGGLSYLAYEGFVNYIIQIQARDGRIKVDVTNITHENLPGNASNCSLGLITDEEKQFTKGLSKGYHNNVANDIKKKMEIYSNDLFARIETFIKNNKSKKEQSW